MSNMYIINTKIKYSLIPKNLHENDWNLYAGRKKSILEMYQNIDGKYKICDQILLSTYSVIWDIISDFSDIERNKP